MDIIIFLKTLGLMSIPVGLFLIMFVKVTPKEQKTDEVK